MLIYTTYYDMCTTLYAECLVRCVPIALKSKSTYMLYMSGHTRDSRQRYVGNQFFPMTMMRDHEMCLVVLALLIPSLAPPCLDT